METTKRRSIRINALRVQQRADAPLFVFALNGRIIHQIAAVDSAKRSDGGTLAGYQREKVSRHIAAIHAYLMQPDAMLPNAIVIALDDSVSFVPYSGTIDSEWGTLGRLEIPVPRSGATKPGLIVDGQQRVAALAQLDPARDFPVIIIGFKTGSPKLQREQFILVNKTKPLPRDLLNELLPHVETKLPRALMLRRTSASILEILRFDPKSPFCGRIRGVGSTGDGCNISQAAVISTIERSMKQGGALSKFTSKAYEDADVEEAARTLSIYFRSVEDVWPVAWRGAPRNSRLVHGVGIYALGCLMDKIMSEVDIRSPRAKAAITRRLRKLRSRCAWTSGRWPTLKCGWNELQNTSQDKRRLAAYLLREYERRSRR